MSKKHFIALADAIRTHNETKQRIWGVNSQRMCFSPEAINTLADFCKAQNYHFNRERWLSYIAGECGPNGGAVKGGK